MAEIDERDILDGDALNDLYQWIDAVPLSRPKKNIARDFSDGVLVAEIIHHYLPRAVDMHNYVAASSTGQKRINWNTLNRKVFSKLSIKLNEVFLNQVVDAKPGAIEQVLWDLRRKIQEHDIALKLHPDHSQQVFKPQLPTKPKPKVMQNSYAAKRLSSVSSLSKVPENNCRTLSMLRPPPIIPDSVIRPLNYPTPVNSPPIVDVDKSSFIRGDSNSNIPDAKVHTGNVPHFLVVRGQKMVSVEYLETKEKEIRELELVRENLLTKIDRLEKLVKIKEDRISELSHTVQNLRSLYEQTTEGKITSVRGSAAENVDY